MGRERCSSLSHHPHHLLIPAAALGKVGHAPHLGSRADLTLLAEVSVNQPRSCEHGNPGPIICQGETWQERDLALHQYLGEAEELSPFLSCGGTGRERFLTPDTCGRADPEVIRELSLLCICCSSGRSDPLLLDWAKQ